MSERRRENKSHWAEIIKFLFIDMPWGLTTLMVYIIGVIIAMGSIVVLMKIVAAILSGFTDDIPFHIM